MLINIISLLICLVVSVYVVQYVYFKKRLKIKIHLDNKELENMHDAIVESKFGLIEKDKDLLLLRDFRQKLFLLIAAKKVVTAKDMYNASVILKTTEIRQCGEKIICNNTDNLYLAYYYANESYKLGNEDAAYLSISIYDKLILLKNSKNINETETKIKPEPCSQNLHKTSMDSIPDVKSWVNSSGVSLNEILNLITF